MRYARREARVALSSRVTVKAGESFRVSGAAVDLSRHGVGLELPRPLLPGTRASVNLDSPALRDVWVLDELPPLLAEVVSSRRLGRDKYRLGMMVDFLPPLLVEHVRDAGEQGDVVASQASLPGLGREALYQVACARLDEHRYDDALRAAVQALDGDPGNRHYRALAYRASAEAALANGQPGDALWHLMKAHAYAPRDPHILSRLAHLRVLVPSFSSAA